MMGGVKPRKHLAPFPLACVPICLPACLPSCPARLQPGAQAKYGAVFAAMLRSSPALQMALQRVATVAQLRRACF